MLLREAEAKGEGFVGEIWKSKNTFAQYDLIVGIYQSSKLKYVTFDFGEEEIREWGTANISSLERENRKIERKDRIIKKMLKIFVKANPDDLREIEMEFHLHKSQIKSIIQGRE